MSKIKKQEKSSAKKPSAPSPKKDQVQEEEEKPFDFGGLPNRDLKKNLGCG